MKRYKDHKTEQLAGALEERLKEQLSQPLQGEDAAVYKRQGDFSASGQRVSTVHARDGEVVESVAFELTVPLEAEAGDYAIILEAAGEGYSDELTIDITVSAEELGNSSFEVEYPEQEGDAQTDFTFSATLINNTLTSQSYACLLYTSRCV